MGSLPSLRVIGYDPCTACGQGAQWFGPPPHPAQPGTLEHRHEVAQALIQSVIDRNQAEHPHERTP
jgi:hypothetical protein